MDSQHKAILASLFDAAVQAAQPAHCLPPHLPAAPRGRTVVIGFGKSAAEMARVVEENWDGDLTGTVLTRYGHTVPCDKIKVLEASHPVPDQAGIDGTKEILAQVEGLTADDLVICLISGGGSALFVQPSEGVTLADKQALTTTLLHSGATIAEINTIRKCFSQVKGGRLAAACAPAKLVSLIISDVPGDDLSLIASGPTTGDESTVDDAIAIIERYNIALPASMAAAIKQPEAATVKADDPRLDTVENILIATPLMSLEAAAQKAFDLGIAPIIVGDDIEGESRDVAGDMAQLALKAKETLPANNVILSGGETTVTIKGKGRGGPNAEFALALALALRGEDDIHAMACDTDGIDGSEDNAGAMISPDTLVRAGGLNVDPAACLDQNNAYEFFHKLDDLVMTGPTLTNVNDFRAILIANKIEK